MPETKGVQNKLLIATKRGTLLFDTAENRMLPLVSVVPLIAVDLITDVRTAPSTTSPAAL